MEFGYQVWYSGKDRSRNRVKIIMDKTFKDGVVDVKGIVYMIIAMKVILF